ncbi:methyltransferase [Sinorhizobium meliloti]|uniref:trimethylamine methyltransferase family protein n=1 Tax=Rhizobium meliloti TaxID=382 RepID=UPI000FD978B3|nr:trimethylamine methyltransferase family protein [Sinorhizobium meliloti]RVH80846.1 methyltransferase [Sinorhizobium meliloti]RVM30496.1 methyltransferase [Sinorhizobium meliloti]RVO10116.1 methyltransferase [Sinorhizobium meliloti]
MRGSGDERQFSRSGRRGGGRRSRAIRGGDGISQLPWQEVVNTYAPMQLLDEERIEALHRNSMRILSEIGIRVMSEKAMALFEKAGAIVDRENLMIRIDESIVEAALATTPSSFTLTSRNPEKRLTIGGNTIAFGLVAGPPNVHDRVNGRRQGNLADYQNFTRLAHHFNAIHILGNQVCAPMELPANSRHLDTYKANLTLSDLCFHCTAIGRGRAVDGINMMAIARGISVEEMSQSPGVITIISVNSPRLFDDAMADGLIAMAEHGQPVTITPFTLMGAMTPVTLAAALCQQNAEALFGVTLAQLVNPGTPVMYGAFTSNVDMRSGAPAFGTPENAKANIIAGQLARRYKLPYRTSNANASNAVDLQAAYETEMATWGAVLGGANLIYHAAGWLEGGLTASYEKLVLDVEILQNMMGFLEPMPFSEDDLGFDAIRSVPAGGHFFGSEHTMARYETAFYQPMLSNWQNYGSWQEAGGRDALERATDIWQQALREYEEPVLDPAIREELDAYTIKRRAEIGAGEP